MDRFLAMRVFVTVAESGSLARAAQRLELSAPAVTRSLAALEKHLGCRLMHRTTRRLSLTEAGGRYLEDCRRLLHELEEIEEWMRGEQSAPQGQVSLTAPVLFGQLFVVPILRDFLDLYPRVDARVMLLDRIVSLPEEGHDLAVRIGELPDSALFASAAGSVRRVICAAPGYLERHGVPREPADLRDHRLIGTMGQQSRWQFRSTSVRVRPRLLVNSNQASVDAALAGWGVARHLSYQVDEPVRAGRLQILLAEHEREPWPIHVLHQGARSVKVRLLLDYLTAGLRQHPALSAVDRVDA